jgi:hypothetical protein
MAMTSRPSVALLIRAWLTLRAHPRHVAYPASSSLCLRWAGRANYGGRLSDMQPGQSAEALD